MMAISMVRAKALCSGAELALVKASTRQEIGSHTAARLKQKQTRARELRDKWRDQVAAQRRTAKAKTGASAGDKNSAEKAALFDEVLSRFTTQLERAESEGKTPGPMGRRRSTKTARSRTHRAERAEVRSELAEAKRVIKAKSKSKKKAAPAKAKAAVAAEPAASEPALAPATIMTKGADTPPKAKRSRVPVAAGATAIVAGREAQGLHVTKQQQLMASANAKQNRLKTGGMIRIQKNRSAANKRSQGRRDSR